MTVEGISIIDADKIEHHSARWSPTKMDYRRLSAHLRILKPELVQVHFTKSDIIKQLIVDIKSRGILDKVLTLSHKLPDKNDRERVQQLVFNYLRGNTPLSLVETKLRPPREGTQLFKAYTELIESLESAYGMNLAKAVTEAHKSQWDSKLLKPIAEKHHVDSFELSYLRCVALKSDSKGSK
jgi:hypothetical protein